MERISESKPRNSAQLQGQDDGSGVADATITLRVRPGNRPGRASRTSSLYSPMSKEEADQVRFCAVSIVSSRRQKKALGRNKVGCSLPIRCARGAFPSFPKPPPANLIQVHSPPRHPFFLSGHANLIRGNQEQARWYMSYSTGPLSAGKLNVTLAAFGNHPDGCVALSVVMASPEDGCSPLRNAQEVCGIHIRRLFSVIFSATDVSMDHTAGFDCISMCRTQVAENA